MRLLSVSGLAMEAAGESRLARTGLRIGLLAVHICRQDVPRDIVGELAPRGGRQDHEIGVLPFGEAAHSS